MTVACTAEAVLIWLSAVEKVVILGTLGRRRNDVSVRAVAIRHVVVEAAVGPGWRGTDHTHAVGTAALLRNMEGDGAVGGHRLSWRHS